MRWGEHPEDTLAPMRRCSIPELLLMTVFNAVADYRTRYHSGSDFTRRARSK